MLHNIHKYHIHSKTIWNCYILVVIKKNIFEMVNEGIFGERNVGVHCFLCSKTDR